MRYTHNSGLYIYVPDLVSVFLKLALNTDDMHLISLVTRLITLYQSCELSVIGDYVKE